MSASEHDAQDASSITASTTAPTTAPTTTTPATDSSAAANPGASMTVHPFNFTGSGSEYFRIWIVNLLLSLLTLGIYSAWAKVRTQRYLHGHTEVAGGRFEYHGEPIPILIGRVLAIGALIVYVLASEFSPLAGSLLGLVLIVTTPYIIVRSFRFNASMSSWRGIRFGFEGSAWDAAGAYLGWPLVGAMTLGLVIPYAWFKQAAFNVNGHRFGQTPFKFGATPSEFYGLALILGMVTFVLAILFGVLIGALGGMDVLQTSAPGSLGGPGILLIGLVGLLAYLSLTALFSGLRFRLIYGDLELGANWVQNSVSVGRFVFIVVTNTIAMMLTLGLYYPWAKIRMVRFLVNSVRLEATDLDGFVAATDSEGNAIGEELGSAFDIGIGV